MAELKPCVEKIGFQNVVTVLATGNVILESEHENEVVRRTLEQGISEQFGYEARALVYTFGELADIVNDYPFDQFDTAKHDYIILMDDGMAHQLMKLAPEVDKTNEQIALGNGVIYWNVTKGMTLDSAFAKQITKAAKQGVTTTRNINTLNKILLKATA
ncbi:MAG: hypothetical protein JWL89_625 [Candidatus Saccharibacteria bacterium]|nr:hypothetical protein [Candidatus Saccharibacteria bacterium]